MNKAKACPWFSIFFECPFVNRMNLLIDKVIKLEHIDNPDGDFLIKRVSGKSVKNRSLTVLRQPSFFKMLSDFFFCCPVENRSFNMDS